MKTRTLIVLLIVAFVLTLGLIFINNSGSPNTPPSNHAYGYRWIVVQSPATGLCYEIARGIGYVDMLGMAEIPCSLLEEFGE